jgi:WD40 repeat protein
LVAAGTAHYENPANLELSTVPIELDRITTSFAAAGYAHVAKVTDPDRDQLRKLFAKAKQEGDEGDLLVAYYTGHGARGADRFYLLTRESDCGDLNETALAAEDLARALIEGSKAAQVLVILDACYAGAGAADLAQVTSRLTVALGGGGPGVFVLAAARTKQEAEQGALSAALEQALANNDERLGSRTQPFLAVDEVMGAIEDYLREQYPKQVATWSSVNVQGRCRLFPNPRHRPELRSGLDLETQRAFAEHWVPKARGAELGAAGWYFTGRERALRELAAWLRQPDSEGRPRVVTGGVGAGKSAVLARVVTLANPTYRTDVLASGAASLDPTTLPPAGVVNVAVHARRKLLADVVAQLAHALDLAVREASDLIGIIARHPHKTVIIVDALDEADDKEQIVSRLLSKLVGLPKVFLLIGTRPDSSQPGQRFRGLDESPVEIDLDDPRYIGADDVARYVERRLLAAEEPRRETPYRRVPEVARVVAGAVAQRAKNVFLVAHTAVIALLAERSVIDVNQPGWDQRLPTGLDGAFDSFLADIDGRRPGGLSSATVRAVLLPLAFAAGEGLPWADLWAAVATGVSGLLVRDADIALVREHAAAFIVEAMESDRSVYRLYHERIAESLRASVDTGRTQLRIVKALYARVPRVSPTQDPDWTRAHPYMLAHLATHALLADVIGELVNDGGFVAAAEPSRTLQILARSTDRFARRAYGSYALAFQNLRDRPTEDRLSYLQMAARQLGDDALADLWTRPRRWRRWSVPWIRGSSISPHRIIGASSNRVTSIALGTLDGRPVLVAGENGGIGVWDLATGAPRGEPLRGHLGWVNSVALGTLDGRPLIVSGGDDRTLRVWDLATGAPRGEALRGHGGYVTSVAVGTFEGRPGIVSGGRDGTVRMWDLATGAPCGEALHGHEGWVSSVALGTLEGRPMVVSSGDDGKVRVWVWDLGTGAPRGEALRGHEGRVRSVALATLDGRPVVISGGEDCTVRVWDLSTGAPRGDVLRGHEGRVRSVVPGTLDGRSVVVSGGDDGTVRVWDLATRAPRVVFRGHESWVSSVALGTLEGRSVIVSGGYHDTVRVWDVATGATRGETLRGHQGWVTSIALGRLEGRPVVVSGGHDGTLRVWDLATGAPRGEPLRGHEGWVTSVAFGSLEGRSVIVSGGHDRTVRVWDLATGAPRGEPLRGHEDWVTSVALGTLDGRPVIVSGGDDRALRVWDLATGAPRGEELRGHEDRVTSIALGTLEGRPVIVSSGYDLSVRVWDLATGAPCGGALRGHTDRVTSIALGTLDGRPVIVSGGDDRAVLVWDLAADAPRGEALGGHNDRVTSVALGTFEGRLLIVSGERDGTVRVRDPAGTDYAMAHAGFYVNAVAFADNGSVVIGGSLGLMVVQLHAR